MKDRVPVIAGVIIACSAWFAFAASPSTGKPSEASIKNGQRIFVQSCASCHDAHTDKAKIGPGLKGYYATHRPKPVDASVRGIIEQGKGTMPGFSSSIARPQTDDLIAYLKTL